MSWEYSNVLPFFQLPADERKKNTLRNYEFFPCPSQNSDLVKKGDRIIEKPR